MSERKVRRRMEEVNLKARRPQKVQNFSDITEREAARAADLHVEVAPLRGTHRQVDSYLDTFTSRRPCWERKNGNNSFVATNKKLNIERELGK